MKKQTCLYATVRNGKLILRSKKTKKCLRQKKSAQDIIDSAKTSKIIYK